MGSVVSINGRTYTGNNITVKNNKVYIDGKSVDDTEPNVPITITVTGNVDKLTVDACQEIHIAGEAGSVSTVSGDVNCGNVKNSVETTSGDVDCESIGGNVETVSGDVTADLISGKVNTVSGDIKQRK